MAAAARLGAQHTGVAVHEWCVLLKEQMWGHFTGGGGMDGEGGPGQTDVCASMAGRP